MNTRVISGVLIEDGDMLTLEEFSYAIRVEKAFILEMIEHELLVPQGNTPQEWRFDSLSLHRGRVATSFYQDLGINMSGIALALDLIDKVDELKRKIALLEKNTK